MLYEKASGSIAVLAHRIYEDSSSSAGAAALPPFQKKRGQKLGKKGKGKGKGGKSKATEYCFEWNRSANGCKEPCPNGRMHCCEGCHTPNVRVVNCSCGMGPPAGKKLKGGTKGKGQ